MDIPTVPAKWSVHGDDDRIAHGPDANRRRADVVGFEQAIVDRFA
jgi:hypothetical protein